MKLNDMLYNCCPNNEPPDWRLFDAIEVSPVIVTPDGHGGEICEAIPYAEREQASMWSVYGHYPAGGVECLTDVATEHRAMRIGSLFEARIRALRA